MLIMNWEQMKNSPATRGFMTIAEVAFYVGGLLSTITFKPAFMSHAQNPGENKLNNVAYLQVCRLVLSTGLIVFSGMKLGEASGQLDPQNVAFTLGDAFLAAGVIDMAGLGLQAIGEDKVK